MINEIKNTPLFAAKKQKKPLHHFTSAIRDRTNMKLIQHMNPLENCDVRRTLLEAR